VVNRWLRQQTFAQEATFVENLDRFDLRILDQLQQDCALPLTELAKRVGLSTSPCWRRVRRLQEMGLIKRQVAQLDRTKLGLGFVVYAYVKLGNTSSATLEAFEEQVAGWEEVVLCELMTGAADYLIKVVTTDVQGYDRFLRTKLLRSGVVTDVQSRIVVSTVKDTSRLPLPAPPG
jgi:Lrp/AsnC family transcriptional regulator